VVEADCPASHSQNQEAERNIYLEHLLPKRFEEDDGFLRTLKLDSEITPPGMSLAVQVYVSASR
jgi:hypothetical protein